MYNWKEKIQVYNEIPELYLIWEKNNCLSQITNELINKLKNQKFDKIITVESKGIIFASPISFILEKPLIIIQKKWKIKNYQNKIEININNWRNEKETLFLDLKNINKNEDFIFIDDIIQSQESVKACKFFLDKTENKLINIYCVANISKKKEIEGIEINSLLP